MFGRVKYICVDFCNIKMNLYNLNNLEYKNYCIKLCLLEFNFVFNGLCVVICFLF